LPTVAKRPTWSDWLTPSSFRVRVSLAAADKLRALRLSDQERLRDMIEEIAELAASMAPSVSRWWLPQFQRPLLQLHAGPISVRYSVDEETRTLSVEHVIVPDGSIDSDDDLSGVA
jgi:hypothetical protein